MSLRPTIYNDKRSEIERQIEEYLKRGGTITTLPTGPADERRNTDVGEPDDEPESSGDQGENLDPREDSEES